MFDNVCVGFVTYNTYQKFDWTKICVSSFRKHLPKVDLIVVDHNSNKKEINFLKSNNAIVLQNPNEKSHGSGLDCIVDFAKSRYEIVVFIEPDCLILDNTWLQNMVEKIKSGYSMAAVHNWEYGALQIGGSAWDIKSIPGSFQRSFKSKEEINHPKFKELINFKYLVYRNENEEYDKDTASFLIYQWDVGIRNWFFLAIDKKACQVKGEGFIHYFGSHQICLIDRLKNHNMPILRNYAINNL
jgi:GT2 family glycosyltransferase